MIKTGTEGLDEFLKGYENITIIYGEGGSGKTTLCLLTAIEQALNNKKILYLDTEINFSTDRVKQILNNRNDKSVNNILVLKINNFNLQHTKIKNLEGIKNISLIIVDSITHHYRRLYSKEPEIAKAMLARQMIVLNEIAKTIPVIITSQVYSNMKEQVNMIGREIIQRYSKKIIKLEKEPRRKIIIETENKNKEFEIIEEGISLT